MKKRENSSETENSGSQLARLKQQVNGKCAEILKLKQDNKQLNEQIKKLDKQVFDLYTLAQAGKTFTGNPDLRRLSEVFTSMVQDRLGIKKCALLLHDRNLKLYTVIKAHGLPHEVQENVQYKPAEGSLWQLIQAGEPFSVKDLSGELRLETVFRENNLQLLESTYWVPLKTKNYVVGILAVKKEALNEDELTFLTLLSSQAAVAFNSAFTYQTLEASRKELDKQMHLLAILYDVSKALHFIDDLTKLLAMVLDESISIVEAEKGSLMLLDEKTDELVVRVVRGVEPTVEEQILNGEIVCTRIPRGKGIAGRVLDSGLSVIINNLAEETEFYGGNETNARNILCVPLTIYEEAIGVINITNKKGRKPFTEQDLSIISTLTSQAAIAINNARLYEMAATDSLTKLYIRRHFNQRLEEEVKRAQRYHHSLGLIMIDIDNFKVINDTYGHLAGDAVLVELSRIFKRRVRSTDIVCRYGGDEFCILLPETDARGSRCFADRLREAVEIFEFPFQEQKLRVTLSMGIATFPIHALDIEELLRKADQSLYAAKQEGKNKVILSRDILLEKAHPKL